MATSRNCLSRNGTRASSPHAMVDLFNSSFRIWTSLINKRSERTCWREGSQKYEDSLRDERFPDEMMHYLEQRGSKDSLGENECNQV